METFLSGNSDHDGAVEPLGAGPHLGHSPISGSQGDRNLANDSDQTEFPLNFSPDYVRDWDTTAAFREFYQNW